MEDDAKLAQITADYKAGKLLTSEVKQILIKVLQDFVKEVQANRAALTDEKVAEYFKIRPLYYQGKEFVPINTRPTAPKPKGDNKGGKDHKAAASTQSDISKLDIRVGKIVEVAKHATAEKLYVEKIDLGEGKLRTVVSGLYPYVPIEQMQGRLVLVLTNLNPRALQGVTSEGMVLVVCNAESTVMELPNVPADAQLGERILPEGDEGGAPETPAVSRKVLDRVLEGLKTNDSLVTTYKGTPLMSSAGQITTKSLKNANIR